VSGFGSRAVVERLGLLAFQVLCKWRLSAASDSDGGAETRATRVGHLSALDYDVAILLVTTTPAGLSRTKGPQVPAGGPDPSM
jgi:hypothetical protein